MNNFTIWLVCCTLLWFCAAWLLIEAFSKKKSKGRVHSLVNVFLVAVPPSVIFLITAWFLSQASPTVQLNAGDNQAMAGWSAWVVLWCPLLIMSFIFSLLNLVWFVVSFFQPSTISLRCMALTACITSIWGINVLIASSPKA